MTVPFVSVVLPVRNATRFLSETIASLRHQTFGDFECIAIDDGSIDDSGAILESAAHVDGRIRPVRQDQQGLVAALNHGLRLARGAYVARIDADDVAYPERFERQVAYLEKHRDVCVLGTAVACIDANGNSLRTPLQIGPTVSGSVRSELLKRNPLPHPTVMFRRAEIVGLGGYRAAFARAEDYDLWLRVSERYDVATLSDTLLRYRIHEGQVTWRGIEQRILSELGAVGAAHLRRLGKPDGCDGQMAIDRALLLSMGFEPRPLSSETARRAIGAAREALGLGHLTSAREAISVAWAQRPIERSILLNITRVCARLLLVELGLLTG